jgi:hypothetical protein
VGEGAESATDARRARAIVASFDADDTTSDKVYETFAELDALPSEAVRKALEAWKGAPLPDPHDLPDNVRRAHGMPPKPIPLTALPKVTDADILDLGPLAEEQLRVAGRSWDGEDLSAEERLDGEREGSLAGTFERRVLVDARVEPAVPVFDVVSFAGDSGVVFRAGSATPVGWIADGKVEVRERHLREAIDRALHADVAPPPAAPGAAAAPAKKSAKKRSSAATTPKKATKAARPGAATKKSAAKRPKRRAT